MIRQFVHRYDFFIEDIISPYKEQIIKEGLHWRDVKPEEEGFNLILNIEPLKSKIQKKFDLVVQENYLVSPPTMPSEVSAYIQNNTNPISFFHHHLLSTIVGVTYLNIPKIGGEIEFLLQDIKVTLKPEPNSLYLFPGWMFHRPLPQKDEQTRICINLDYHSKDRPMHKASKTQW